MLVFLAAQMFKGRHNTDRYCASTILKYDTIRVALFMSIYPTCVERILKRMSDILCLSCVYIIKTKTTVNYMPLVVCLHTQNKDNSQFYAFRCVSTYSKQRKQSILCLSLCVYILKTKTTVNSMPLVVCLHTQNKDNS